MEDKEMKQENIVSKKNQKNDYKEKFQFIFSVNDNKICARYFKISGFNSEILESLDFVEEMDKIVNKIKDELNSKSRIYLWYTNNMPTKLTGFVSNKEDICPDERRIAWDNSFGGKYVFSNGREINKTFYKDEELKEEERPAEGEYIFKFQFLIDEEVVYENIWDGNNYPRYVRNSVDLSNSDALYKDKEPMSLHFSLAIIRHFNIGRSDMIYSIIKNICDLLSSDNKNIKKYVTYGDTTYYMSTYNKIIINSWRKYVENKTKKYEKTFYNLNDNVFCKHLDYIDNNL